LPTAAIDHEVNTNTHIDPSMPPMKIAGSVMSTDFIFFTDKKFTSSMNALNSKKQARLAEPTEYPFVFAFVTLPTASKISVILRTSSGC
jgi:hypothetical protein